MNSVNGIFGLGLMRYNESQLFDRFRNDFVSPPYYELDTDLLRYLEIFARFLIIYRIKLKVFKVLISFNFDDTYRMIKLEKKEQRKYKRERKNLENKINIQRNILKSIVFSLTRKQKIIIKRKQEEKFRK
jgi:hypothetical protein